MRGERSSSVRASSRAAWPLSNALVDEVQPAAAARMWQEVRARLDVTAASRPRVTWSSWVAAAAGATVAALVVVGLNTWWPRDARKAPVIEAPRVVSTPSPLVVPALDASVADAPIERRLSDGSRIVVEPGAQLSTLASTSKELVLKLQAGKAHFRVTPGGLRKWVIEAGVISVEVVGTEFSVARAREGARVEVVRGAVLVRSEELEDGVERVEAGGGLTVGSWPPDADEASGDDDRASEPGTQEAAASRAPSRRRRVSVERLLDLADQARVSGDRARARRSLRRIVREFPQDPRAAVSAFQLGVLELGLGSPERAVESLRLALQRAGSLSLREDCYLRLAEAHVQNGSPQQARGVARSYQREFSDGRHQGAIERLLARAEKKRSAKKRSATAAPRNR